MQWLVLLLRNRVARVTIIGLLPVLYVLWSQLGSASGAVIGEGEATGVITEVYKHAYRVTLDDGPLVRVFRNRTVDKGARVALHFTRYDSGITHYDLPRDERR